MRTAPGARERRARLALPDPARSIAALVCGGTAVAYSSFVLSAWAGSPLPVSRGYVSELEAVGQPHRDVFRWADVLSGAGLVVVALIVAVHLVARRHGGLVGCAMLALAGFASLLDAANSMSCVPSIDAFCRAQQDTASGLVRQVIAPHTISSLLGFLAAAGAMLLVGTALTTTRPWFSRLSITCSVLTGLLGLGDGVLIVTDGAVGLTERGRIMVFSVWLLAVGAQLLRPSTTRCVVRDARSTDWSGSIDG
ncbi:MAG: DUF998 domain-containing protein [Nocardioidaceae bacterium]